MAIIDCEEKVRNQDQDRERERRLRSRGCVCMYVCSYVEFVLNTSFADVCLGDGSFTRTPFTHPTAVKNKLDLTEVYRHVILLQLQVDGNNELRPDDFEGPVQFSKK